MAERTRVVVIGIAVPAAGGIVRFVVLPAHIQQHGNTVESKEARHWFTGMHRVKLHCEHVHRRTAFHTHIAQRLQVREH
jgi:hypothetical protein